MSKCKNCRKQMKSANPNKKFCSNKGFGNCKDAFNNRRAMKKKHFDNDDFGHHFSAGYLGHGQE